jgi:hypothetical protein
MRLLHTLLMEIAEQLAWYHAFPGHWRLIQLCALPKFVLVVVVGPQKSLLLDRALGHKYFGIICGCWRYTDPVFGLDTLLMVVAEPVPVGVAGAQHWRLVFFEALPVFSVLVGVGPKEAHFAETARWHVALDGQRGHGN